jgi:bifunctional non-homologous end joining protein LigD
MRPASIVVATGRASPKDWAARLEIAPIRHAYAPRHWRRLGASNSARGGRAACDAEQRFDGEVIVVDETGRPQFYYLLRNTRTPAYVAFDIVWLNGADLRSRPLHERRRVLQTVLPKGSPIVSEALSVEGKGCELFDLMCGNDLEGIVAKRLADPYDSRVKWHKIKNRAYTQKEGRSDLFNGPRRPRR